MASWASLYSSMIRCSGTPVTKETASSRPSWRMASRWSRRRLALADHHEVGRAARCGAWPGLEQEGQALHGDVGAGGGDETARHRGHGEQGTEQVEVHAHRHDGHLGGIDAVVDRDVLERVLRHRDHAQALRHPGLHVGERVPAPEGQALVPGLGVLDLEAAVDGDGVVDRASTGKPAAGWPAAVAEALVVVDDRSRPCRSRRWCQARSGTPAARGTGRRRTR